MDHLKWVLVYKILKLEVYCKIVKQVELLQYREAPGYTLGKLFRMRDWENADAEIGIVRSGMTRMSFLPSRSPDTNL